MSFRMASRNVDCERDFGDADEIAGDHDNVIIARLRRRERDDASGNRDIQARRIRGEVHKIIMFIIREISREIKRRGLIRRNAERRRGAGPMRRAIRGLVGRETDKTRLDKQHCNNEDNENADRDVVTRAETADESRILIRRIEWRRTNRLERRRMRLLRNRIVRQRR